MLNGSVRRIWREWECDLVIIGGTEGSGNKNFMLEILCFEVRWGLMHFSHGLMVFEEF